MPLKIYSEEPEFMALSTFENRRVISASLTKSGFFAMAMVLTSVATPAHAQLYEIESDAIDTPFDRILKWSRLQEVEEYVVRDVKPFIVKFCNKKDRRELLEANFICKGYVCTTTRTWTY
ncbi:hypothetical protein [Microvirga lenta]|uniref:hypothetical protein n=1 Tax=Microvirga lenta TaxID=2881337 RepID=UPI001CFFE2AF|nr:hypothetical protein [Microvirga lenta]MCB5176209.1 hypothetical protein [Microvirga lenta]